MVIEGHQLNEAQTLKTHTVVIGSGAGGGVSSYHIAKAGFATIVLEEGGYFQAKDFNQREEDMMPAIYRSKGQQLTTDGMINVFQGSAFGGSTLVNTADATPIEPEVLEHWHAHYGITEYTQKSLAPSYKRVYKQANVSKIDDNLINRNNGILLETADKLGIKSGVFETNRKGCVGSSYCLLGCAYDAKQGTNLSFLPQAMAAGAKVFTDIRVDRLEKLNEGGYKVHASVVERGSRKLRFAMTIIAERVILSAGTIHSPAILKRSGFDKSLPQLGKNVSLQPLLGVMARFDESEDFNLWRGIPQSTFISEYDDNTKEHGLGGYRWEGIGGVVGIFAQGVNGFGQAHKSLMKNAKHILYSQLLIPDSPSGEIDFDWQEDGTVSPKINYVIKDEWKVRLKNCLKDIARFNFAAGAKEILITHSNFAPLTRIEDIDKIDNFPIEPGMLSLFSAHPQGSCRMGTTVENSVVDQSLQVHGFDNLYVMDASIMPTSASTHTMIPTMVMTDFAVHKMLAKTKKQA